MRSVELDPGHAGDPAGVAATPTNGHIDYDILDPPLVEFDVDFNSPPKTLAPGSTYSFKVYVRGRITGGNDTQGYRTADAILLVDDGWQDRSADVGIGQDCHYELAGPISCTPPANATGTFNVPVPSSGKAFTFGVSLLNCSGCYVRYSYVFTSGSSTTKLIKPTKPKAPAAPKRIEQTPEYRDFYGLRDPGRSGWLSWMKRQSEALRDRAASYPGVTGKVVIPGEGTIGRHTPNLLYPKSDLFVLLGLSIAPEALVADGNVYAKVTPVYERKLRREILRVKGQLLPADVLEMALRVTGGSYPLAVLTAHNLLKNVTYIGRGAITLAKKNRMLFERFPERFLEKLRPQVAIARKLVSLRANPRKDKDKMGPWYHGFAILSAGAMARVPGATIALVGEHLLKYLKSFQNEGGFNLEKAQSDTWMYAAAVSPELQDLSR